MDIREKDDPGRERTPEKPSVLAQPLVRTGIIPTMTHTNDEEAALREFGYPGSMSGQTRKSMARIE